MPARAMYRLQIKGEKKTYSLAGPITYDREEIAEIIGDLAGYKPSFVLRRFIRPMKPGKKSVLGDDLGIGLGAIKLVVERVR